MYGNTIGEALIGMAILIGLGGLVVGGGVTVAGGKLLENKNDIVGVELTKEQQVLRKNGALCDAYLIQAFDKALAAENKKDRIVKLELPANPAQNCPMPKGRS